ncbi:MAG: class I SAM-dependent methyltransferase [Myxococcota bacterium]
MDLREHAIHEGERHPWERSRAAFFETVFERHRVRGAHLLDAGAGDGWTAARLAHRSGAAATCWDILYTDEQLEELRAALPKVHFVRDQPDGPFDVALMLDVLEHVEDDDGFLAGVRDRLQPGGLAVVSVPAWPALFSEHDVFLQHHRRYRPGEARDLMERGGFAILESGGLFHGLLPVRSLQVAFEKLGRRSATTSLGEGPKGLVNNVITKVLVLEQRLSFLASGSGLMLPGLSWWCVARKL